MRLDKLLAQAGYSSRNQIKKLIRSRQVRIDGDYAKTDGQNVDPGLHHITISGKELRHSSDVYYLLHKPQGVVSARTDDKHETVLDLIVPEDRVEGLYPVGRLDRDTEGLVLLTNNGPLGFRMLHPKHHVTKIYYVEVNGLLEQDAPTFFENGIRFLDGTVCKPAQLMILEATDEKSCASVTISEGKFHKIKKMFLAYGLKVIYLKRTTFGPLELGDLERGHYRTLRAEEMQLLKEYFD